MKELILKSSRCSGSASIDWSKKNSWFISPFLFDFFLSVRVLFIIIFFSIRICYLGNWAPWQLYSALGHQSFSISALTSKYPPRSLVYRYRRKRSRGFFEMVGHWVMGVPFSSIKPNNFSRKTRRSGWSSISYKRTRLSELREDVCCGCRIFGEEKNKKRITQCAKFSFHFHAIKKLHILKINSPSFFSNAI